MKSLFNVTLSVLLIASSVGCYNTRWAGYPGYAPAACPGGACGTPVPGAPIGGPGTYAPQGAYFSPTNGSTVNVGTPMAPTAMSAPVYTTPYPTTALAPSDPLPTF